MINHKLTSCHGFHHTNIHKINHRLLSIHLSGIGQYPKKHHPCWLVNLKLFSLEFVFLPSIDLCTNENLRTISV